MLAAASAQAATLNFEFTSSDVLGTGSAVFDEAGAPSLDPYEYRPGDTFLASFDFGSVVIPLTEADALNPIQITFQSGNPADIFYAGSLVEGPGKDLGILDFISVTMSQGGFTLQLHYDTGEESTINGTYAFVQDQPPTSVPEPASATLLGAGLAALAWRRRRA
jgi:hypothetical protein